MNVGMHATVCILLIESQMWRHFQTKEASQHVASTLPAAANGEGEGHGDEEDDSDSGGGDGGSKAEVAKQPADAASAADAAGDANATEPASAAELLKQGDAREGNSAKRGAGDGDGEKGSANVGDGERSSLETRWAEKGVGQLRLLGPKAASGDGSESHPRLVMRVENVGRLILNESLLPTTGLPARLESALKSCTLWCMCCCSKRAVQRAPALARSEATATQRTVSRMLPATDVALFVVRSTCGESVRHLAASRARQLAITATIVRFSEPAPELSPAHQPQTRTKTPKTSTDLKVITTTWVLKYDGCPNSDSNPTPRPDLELELESHPTGTCSA